MFLIFGGTVADIYRGSVISAKVDVPGQNLCTVHDKPVLLI